MSELNWPEITAKLPHEKGDEGKALRKVFFQKTFKSPFETKKFLFKETRISEPKIVLWASEGALPVVICGLFYG